MEGITTSKQGYNKWYKEVQQLVKWDITSEIKSDNNWVYGV